MNTRYSKKWYVACYDIRCPKRLRKVYKLLKAEAIHIQYSVFIIKANKQHTQELLSQLASLIKQEDDIRFYPIQHPSQLWYFGNKTTQQLTIQPRPLEKIAPQASSYLFGLGQKLGLFKEKNHE